MILIVEVDAFIRKLAEITIQDYRYATCTASSVDQALSLLRSPRSVRALSPESYLKALVLGGCELARQAVRLRPGLPVLYTTRNYVSKDLKSQFVTGADCLGKPYTPDQLRRVLVKKTRQRPACWPRTSPS